MPPSVHIAAPRPLLRSGLERIARDAGTVITSEADADIILRIDQPPTNADLDVVVDDATVIITCGPDPIPGSGTPSGALLWPPSANGTVNSSRTPEPGSDHTVADPPCCESSAAICAIRC